MITKEELIKILNILDNTYGVNDGGIAWDDEDKKNVAEGILKQLNSETESSFIDIEYESDEYNRLFPELEVEDYKKLVGKCFMCDDSWAVKVVGIDPNNPNEFLYERYEKYNDESWNVQDYIWLQDMAERDPKYKKYCLTPQTEKNIASESMFHLGSDGNLYESVDCDAFYKYTPMDSERFEEIKKQAIENYEEYE